jgi:transposase-like protein
MSGRPRLPLKLTDEDRRLYERLAPSLEKSGRDWKRLRVLLDYNKYPTNAALAKALGCVSAALISKVVRLYREGGRAAVQIKKSPGPLPNATDAQVEKVLQLRQVGDRRKRRPKLSYKAIAERTGIHPSSVVRIIKRAGREREQPRRSVRRRLGLH